ncbi:adenosine deaminase, partial [Candidatus Roizmanbacteria bacterium CG09_land_8_20_14_0_10_41_9]
YAIEKAVHHAISNAYRKANITTLEIRFNPMLRNKGGEQDLDKIIFSALVGMKRACLEYPVKAGIILMMDRRFNKRKNEIIAKKAVRFKQDGVIGIDLAGPIDNDFKIDDIVQPVELAKASGIKVTIHTGEITPSKEIWEVMEKLNPDRIGHGIRAVDDIKLLDVISKKGIVLELCPTSNLRTCAVKDMREIESIIRTLKKHSVAFTINSDGPEFLQTDVKRELELLLQNRILDRQGVLSIIRFARKASFIPL